MPANQITSMTAEVARKAQLRKAQAMEQPRSCRNVAAACRSWVKGVCWMPVRFKLDTAAAADPALIIATENTCPSDIRQLCYSATPWDMWSIHTSPNVQTILNHGCSTVNQIFPDGSALQP
jgi:hypothetical protein